MVWWRGLRQHRYCERGGQQSNFHDYPVIRLRQMPKVEVHPAKRRTPTEWVNKRPRQ